MLFYLFFSLNGIRGHIIYRSLLRESFKAYEGVLYEYFVALVNIIKEGIFIDKPKENKNASSDEEEPWDSTPDEEREKDSSEEENIKKNDKKKK